MQYFELGDLRLSRAILGGHEYLPSGASRGFSENLSRAVTPGVVLPGFGQAERRSVLAAAYEAGINLFDVTIDSEKEALGRNVREMPPPYEVFVQTRPEGMVYGYDPGNRRMADFGLLRAEVQRILGLMRRDRIDILNLGILRDAIDGDPDYIARLADAIATLRSEGLIRYAAADTFSGEATYLAMIESGAFASLNINFNFLETAPAAAVIPRAVEKGMAVVAREVFGKGSVFAGARAAGHSDLDAIARAATNWVVGQPGVSAFIVGAVNQSQLRNSIVCLNGSPGRCPTDLLERLMALESLQRHQAEKHDQFSN